MTIKVITSNDIGKGLSIANNKLNVVDGVFKAAKFENETLTLTTVADTEVALDLSSLKSTVDVKLSGAELTSDNKLKLTLSDASEFEVDLAKFLNVIPTAEDLWAEIIELASFAEDVKTKLGTVEVQGLDGTVLFLGIAHS